MTDPAPRNQTIAREPGLISSRPLYPVHPLAALLPMMSGDQFEELKASIAKKRRLDFPIVLHEGKIIDGRNREQACRELGIRPRFAKWDGRGDLGEFIMSANLYRRHLTDDQRAIVSAKHQQQTSAARRRIRARKGGLARHGLLPSPVEGQARTDSLRESARLFNLSKKKAERGRQLLKSAPDLAERVFARELTLTQAIHQRDSARRAREMKAKAATVPARSTEFKVITGDCIAQAHKLEPEFRLIFADPPYNEEIDYGPGKAADALSDAEYLDWSGAWMRAAAKLLTDDGSLWVMISDRYAFDFPPLLRAAGLHRQGLIVWHERFGTYRKDYFGRCARFIFHCVKDPDRFVFNAAAVTGPSERQVRYNDPRANPAGMILGNVWDIPRLCGTCVERQPEFKTQLPVELLAHIVGCASDPGDKVLDPFSGSGTTGAACIALGRRFTGIEKNPARAAQSIERLRSLIADRKSQGALKN